MPDFAAGDLEPRVAATAGALRARGIGPGDRVAIALPAGEDFVVALYACLRIRAAAVPVDLREATLRTAGAAVVVDGRLEGDPVARAEPDDDDVVLVVHTSGTTSAPKEVALTWGNVVAHAHASRMALNLGPGERWLCPMPLTHVGGLMVLLRALIHGWLVLLEPPPFDAERIAERIQEGHATMVSLVPTMLTRVLNAGLEHPRWLRCVLLGGGPVDPALAERARAAGVPVAQTYGLSEACSMVTVSVAGDAETAGTPLPGVDVRLAGDGEILVSGSVVAGGGTLHTGDLGRFDERGNLTVVGRKADTIVSGGENVAPAEVEAVLLAHPAVAEAGVFARPHPEWGEAVSAKVVLRPGATTDAEELRAWCAARLAPYKVPKSLEFVDVLPRTASGKLLRRRLR